MKSFYFIFNEKTTILQPTKLVVKFVMQNFGNEMIVKQLTSFH